MHSGSANLSFLAFIIVHCSLHSQHVEETSEMGNQDFQSCAILELECNVSITHALNALEVDTTFLREQVFFQNLPKVRSVTHNIDRSLI